jgi:hypothetical protein
MGKSGILNTKVKQGNMKEENHDDESEKENVGGELSKCKAKGMESVPAKKQKCGDSIVTETLNVEVEDVIVDVWQVRSLFLVVFFLLHVLTLTFTDKRSPVSVCIYIQIEI